MGGKTSNQSKYKYNLKAYDRLGLTLYKGDKDIITAAAKTAGKSTNQYIYDILRANIPGLQAPKELEQ